MESLGIAWRLQLEEEAAYHEARKLDEQEEQEERDEEEEFNLAETANDILEVDAEQSRIEERYAFQISAVIL